MRTTINLPALALVLQAAAQSNNAFDFRHATGNGPYPIYIAAQWVHCSSVTALVRLSEASTALGEVPGRMRQHGVEVSLGAVINEDNFMGMQGVSLHRLSVEVGYKFLTRGFEDDGGQTLRTRQGLLGVRFGWRWNFIYPLTLHFQGGPILLHSARVSLLRTDNTELTEVSRRVGVCGFDTRARLVFFDPVGSTGGFSLFVEGQFIYSFDGPSVNGFREMLDASKKGSPGSFDMGVLSVGTTIPLALKVR